MLGPCLCSLAVASRAFFTFEQLDETNLFGTSRQAIGLLCIYTYLFFFILFFFLSLLFSCSTVSILCLVYPLWIVGVNFLLASVACCAAWVIAETDAQQSSKQNKT